MIGIPARYSFFAVLSALPFVVQGQPPSGYYFGSLPVLPDSAYEVLANGRFRVTIQRATTGELQRRLISIAERLFPDSAAINRVAAAETRSIVAQRLREAALAPGDRWWWESFDAVWTPFAVTGAAVEYYRRRIYERSAERNPFESGDPGAVHNGAFEYRAWVDTIVRDTAAAHIVRLSISWSYWCGRLCAVYFTKTRAVYFRNDGTVLRIEGDGKPAVVVS